MQFDIKVKGFFKITIQSKSPIYFLGQNNCLRTFFVQVKCCKNIFHKMK